MAKLLETARILGIEESGGHGDKWDVFDKDINKFLARALPVALKDSNVLIDEMSNTSSVPEGEEPVSVLVHLGELKSESDSVSGLVSILGSTEDEHHKRVNTLISFFPMFATDISYNAYIDGIELFPNHFEARLWLKIPNLPFEICIFDTAFGVHRGKYDNEIAYDASLSALAYYMRSTEGDEYKIEDEDGIRKHNATDAWVKKHGLFNRDTDLELALAEWKPSSPEDLEPVVFDLSRRRSFIPHDTFADDAQFAGKVIQVIPNDTVLFDVSFWRVDVQIGNFEDDEETAFIVPIYTTENCFGNDWRPKVGEYISGNGWFNGFLNTKK